MKQEEQLDEVRMRKALGILFDGVFYAAIHSGLLIEKAIEKAERAVANYDSLVAARDRAIDAKMNGTTVEQS